MLRSKYGGVLWLAAIFCALWAWPCVAQSAGKSIAGDGKESAIELPPMGWSSWNSFSNTVNSEIVVRQTQALVSSGMKAAGYAEINIDEGWWMGKRDEQGNMVVDPKQWPSLQPGERDGDMANIVHYIHGAGLKAGIYTDAGEAGCSFYGPDLGPPVPHTGSEGYYDRDFLQFAQWGFDSVKVDWCGGSRENLDPAVQYAEIARAIGRAEAMTGHRLYYSICNWGGSSPWTWAPGIGGVGADMWRTSGDIVAPIVANTPNATRRASFQGVLSNFDQGIHNEAQHTGYYNDPDMMTVGMPGLTEAQNRAHMSLWAISGAPLIVGADLSKLDGATKAILTNARVIGVDQDPLGVQAIEVQEARAGLQVWVKPLAAAGDRAVLLLNRTAEAATIEVFWKQLGLDAQTPAAVVDLWSGKPLESNASGYAAQVAAGDAAFVLVHGEEGPAASYEASAPVRRPGESGDEALFSVAPVGGVALVRIPYENRGGNAVTAQLRVDGKTPTNVLFAPTGTAQEMSVAVCEVESKRTAGATMLSFRLPASSGVRLKSISVQAFGRP